MKWREFIIDTLSNLIFYGTFWLLWNFFTLHLTLKQLLLSTGLGLLLGSICLGGFYGKFVNFTRKKFLK